MPQQAGKKATEKVLKQKTSNQTCTPQKTKTEPQNGPLEKE